MKQRIFLAGVLMVVCALVAFAQNSKSNMAVLAFTGGQGNEGEAVAELFSYDPQLIGRFGIMPRTSITRGVEKEYDFQKFSGIANAGTAAAIGEQLGAQYVMAGSITALGGQKLLVVAIIRIETVQQVAGDYLMYTTEEELRDKVPGVVQNLLPMFDVDTSGMEKLAVPPVQLEGTSERDADTLAQILSIALMRNKSYAIYPRTTSLDQVQQEFDTQKGVADYRQAAQIGKGETPRLVLSVAARRLGTSDMFNASIIDMEYGTLINGTSEQYANMSDGITAMDVIARILSGQSVSAAEQRRRNAEITSTANREETARRREEATRRRAEERERFNEKAGLVFAVQGGMSIISKDIIDKKIFGEPSSESEKDSDASTNESNRPGGFGFPLGALVGFQYSWFSISTGLGWGLGYGGPSQIKYTFLQVPVLLKGDWNLVDSYGFNLFAGMGYNIPVNATAALAVEAYGKETTYDATLAMPPSILVGGGLSGKYWYWNIRFVFDIADTEVKLEDGRTGSFFRTSFDLLLGVRYRLFFSNGSR
jgi:TolB-like protein